MPQQADSSELSRMTVGWIGWWGQRMGVCLSNWRDG